MISITTLEPRTGRFLHIVPDDKFIDSAHVLFEEVAPGASDYICFSDSSVLQYIRTFQPLCLPKDQADGEDLTKVLPGYSGVLVHYLNQSAKLLVDSSPVGTRFAWLAWGADYYHLILDNEQQRQSKTRALCVKLEAVPPKGSIPKKPVLQKHISSLSEMARNPRGKLNQMASRKRRRGQRDKLRQLAQNSIGEMGLLNRFICMSPPIREDHTLLLERNPALTLPYFDWNYGNQALDEGDYPMQPTGNNVLLGNSAAPENNHLDALALFPEMLPDDTKIICPLSYGDMQYGDAVARYGHTRFGEKFVALREFVDATAYADIVSSCSMVVMNHVRQQALGNILMALSSGAGVFLNPASPVNAAMDWLGVKVCAIDEIARFLRHKEPFPSVETVLSTRSKLRRQYGREAVAHKTRALLDQLHG